MVIGPGTRIDGLFSESIVSFCLRTSNHPEQPCNSTVSLQHFSISGFATADELGFPSEISGVSVQHDERGWLCADFSVARTVFPVRLLPDWRVGGPQSGGNVVKAILSLQGSLSKRSLFASHQQALVSGVAESINGKLQRLLGVASLRDRFHSWN